MAANETPSSTGSGKSPVSSGDNPPPTPVQVNPPGTVSSPIGEFSPIGSLGTLGRRTSLSVDPLQLRPPPSLSGLGVQAGTGSTSTRSAATGLGPSQQAAKPPSGIPPPPPPPTGAGGSTTVSFQMDGMVVECLGKPDIQTKTTCLNKKEDRNTLDADVKRDLFAEATKKVFPKFHFVSAAKLNLNATKGEKDDKGTESLEDEASLSHLIAQTRERHMAYDMHDVFNIVFPTDPKNGPMLSLSPDQSPTTVNLYTQYTQVTLAQVAVSNYWYNTWVNPTKQPWVRENMQLTYSQLAAHTTVELHQKILETYSRFEVSYRGGPLYFKIMVDLLVSSFTQVADSMIKSITNLKISSVKGEDVMKIVSLIRAGLTRLATINRIPPNMPPVVLRVYQTSSVPEFNEVFRHLELNMSIFNSNTVVQAPQNLLSDPLVTVQNQDTLLQTCETWNSFAETKYTELSYEGKWCVGTNQQDPSIHLAKMPARIFKASALLNQCCWNCGEEGHSLKDCPHQRNDVQIELNRKAFHEAKERKKNGGGTSNKSDSKKFAPPAKGESNRRTIDGKDMYYHFKSKRWLPSTQKASHQEGGTNTGTGSSGRQSSADGDAQPSDIGATLAECTEKFGSLMVDLQTKLQQS